MTKVNKDNFQTNHSLFTKYKINCYFDKPNLLKTKQIFKYAEYAKVSV